MIMISPLQVTKDTITFENTSTGEFTETEKIRIIRRDEKHLILFVSNKAKIHQIFPTIKTFIRCFHRSQS